MTSALPATISVQDLSRRFGSVEALRGITFDVKPGEFVGLIGHNGAGKTTALRILTGNLPPSGGSVRVAGLDVQAQPREARAAMGYTPEVGNLNLPLHVAWIPDVDGRWLHWNHEILPHWNEQTRRNFPTGPAFHPPDSVHSPFYPSRGCYSVSHAETVLSHMEEMHANGIGVAVVSWWGRCARAPRCPPPPPPHSPRPPQAGGERHVRHEHVDVRQRLGVLRVEVSKF